MLAIAWNACVKSRNHINGWIREKVRLVGLRISLRTHRLKMAGGLHWKIPVSFSSSAPPGTETGLRRGLLELGPKLLSSELDEHIVKGRLGHDKVVDPDVHTCPWNERYWS